jgi:hypothetical protein
MMAFGMVAVVLSFSVLAAHFLRDGSVVMVAVCLLLPVLLFFPRKGAARVVQAALVLGTIEWIRTLVTIVQERMAAGVPYTRTMIILAVVAALTLASALVFRMPRMRRRYDLER